jgi:integration host factor subunit beta
VLSTVAPDFKASDRAVEETRTGIMTKSDLIERLCQDQKLPKGKAELLVNSIFDCLEQALRRGERIEIRGFGSFEIRRYKAYQGRNPKTGVPVSVQEKRLPFFKVGKELKERVNGPDDEGPGGGSSTSGNGHPSSHTPSSSGTSQTSGAAGAETTAPARE